MAKKLVIQHNLAQLSAEALEQYKRDVSEFIGLDPDLSGLDTVWMPNETGPGQSLVLYARRGTAEILRNNLGIEVVSLDPTISASGSIVFKAIGKNKAGRQEIAIGSKDLTGLHGKQLDDAIMTASTRALRRLTMQFTTLGILDESEVRSVLGDTTNPASGAQLAGSPVVLPPAPSVPANNAPGKDITKEPDVFKTQVASVQVPESAKEKAQYSGPDNFSAQQQAMRDEASRQLQEKADKKADPEPPVSPVTPVVAADTAKPEAPTEAVKPRRARKPRNTVSMGGGVEPEVVNNAPTPAPAPPAVVVEAPAPPVVPHGAGAGAPSGNGGPIPPISVPVVGPDPVQTVVVPISAFAPPAQASEDFLGKPTAEQMTSYRKRVGVYTTELPASEGMGSVQKMRAFITKMGGTAPQFMTVEQWEEQLAWFESFVAKNQVKGLVKYINDLLGTK